MLSTSLFVSSLLLLLAFTGLIRSTRGEIFLIDNARNGVSLPNVGGAVDTTISVSSAMTVYPYILTIYVRDDSSHTEQFYFNSLNFGIRTVLANATHTASTINSPTVLCTPVSQCLGSATAPVTGNGTYVYTFLIQPQTSATVNVTYQNLGPDPLPITEYVQISIFNPLVGPGAIVVGDPQFVGLRGQSYQVHGIDGAVYNIISEEKFQLNSRFVFLTEGQCPTVNGKKGADCWSHPGSYLGEIGVQAVVGSAIHRARLISGPAADGFDAVEVDGRQLSVGDEVDHGSDFIVALIDTHTVRVTSKHFFITFSNSDMFINQALRTLVPVKELTSHGLLGQTHSAKKYANAIRHIEGQVDDYAMWSNDLYGTDFLYNKFVLPSSAVEKSDD